MQYVHLGRSGLRVSRLCLGTMNFGPYTNEADSFKIMDRALEHGINFFDTANVYGGRTGEGVTEQIIGRWFAQEGGRREKVVLATKVYGRMGDWPNQARLSALHIKRACEESLRRLRTDHIDLYQMHHVDRETPWVEIWQTMEQLYREGKVLYVGSSNFAGWHIAQAQEIARSRHFLGLVSEQSLYNLHGLKPTRSSVARSKNGLRTWPSRGSFSRRSSRHPSSGRVRWSSWTNLCGRWRSR